jgi:ATP-dependent Clp protease adaptor protein ClpS
MSTATLPEAKEKVGLLPPYHVVLRNDDDHTVDYVVEMMKALFGHPDHKGLRIAAQVHNNGRCVVWTGSKEVAEFKQEQIHSYGPDSRVPECKGSMTAEIEPAQ